MRRMTPFCLPALVLLGCQAPSQGMTDEDRASVMEEVREQTISLCDSWNTLDPPVHLRHYAEDMRWGGNAEFLVGEGFRKGVESFMGMFSEYDQRWQNIDIQVLAPNVAVAGVTLARHSVGRDGEVSEGVDAMTLVWQRTVDGWRVVHGHTSLK